MKKGGANDKKAGCKGQMRERDSYHYLQDFLAHFQKAPLITQFLLHPPFTAVFKKFSWLVSFTTRKWH